MGGEKFTDVFDMLGRIEASGVLGQSDRHEKLLRYLVEEEVGGRGDAIKAFSVAMDVFGRSDSFDASRDNIVRVEVGRLRQKLSHYYTTTGADDKVVISIPKGTYRPSFASRDAVAVENQTTHLAERLGASLTVLPFYALSPDMKLTGLAAGLANQLFIELSRMKLLSIAHSGLPRYGQLSFDVAEICEKLGVKYAIQGAVQPFSDSYSVSVDLFSAESGRVIWARSYEADLSQTSASQAALIQRITLDLRPLFYNQENLALESANEEDLSAEELFVLSTWLLGAASSSLDWERKRLELAKRALAMKPHFGKAHSVMADKLVYLSAIDPESDTEAAVEAAKFHAVQAAELAPNDADVFFNIAMHHWHQGNLERATIACERAVDLDPSNGAARVMQIGIPYTCSHVPLDVIERIDDFDASLSQDNPVRWFCKTLKGRLLLNNGLLEECVKLELGANQFYCIPDTAMRLGTVLFKLGREDEAFSLINAQIANWPTFDTKHLTEVSLARRRRQCPDKVDTVLEAYRAFSAAYQDFTSRRVLTFGS